MAGESLLADPVCEDDVGISVYGLVVENIAVLTNFTQVRTEREHRREDHGRLLRRELRSRPGPLPGRLV